MAVRTKMLQFSRHFMIPIRFCSADSTKISSNRDFTVFTTKENLQDFKKVPHRKITKNILFHEHPNPGTCDEFGLENQDLINGSLMAIGQVCYQLLIALKWPLDGAVKQIGYFD